MNLKGFGNVSVTCMTPGFIFFVRFMFSAFSYFSYLDEGVVVIFLDQFLYYKYIYIVDIDNDTLMLRIILFLTIFDSHW